MRDALRKQLRCHLLHFLVCHIDRQSALVCDAQPPECCPSEIVKVRNVRPVCLRQCDLQIAQPRFYVLVLVVKFRVHLHAAPVGLLKVPVHRLLRDPAGLEIFVHHFLNGRLQDLLPCRKRHRERLLYGRRRLPAHPAQIVLRLLRNAVQRESGRPTLLLRILRHRIADIRIIPVKRSDIVRCTLDLILAERDICVCATSPASRVVCKDNSVIPRLFECIRQNFLCPHRKRVCLACPFFNDMVLRIEYTLKLRCSIKGAAAFSRMVFLPFRQKVDEIPFCILEFLLVFLVERGVLLSDCIVFRR